MFLKKVNFKKFRFNFSTKEPKEFRTLFLKELPPDWEEDEIRVKLQQIGPVERLHMVRNSLGEYLGRGKY